MLAIVLRLRLGLVHDVEFTMLVVVLRRRLGLVREVGSCPTVSACELCHSCCIVVHDISLMKACKVSCFKSTTGNHAVQIQYGFPAPVR